MTRLHNFIALYFNLSRKEANGFIILCFLIPIFIFIPWLGRFCFSSVESLSEKDQKTMNILFTQMKNQLIREKNASLKAPSPEVNTITSFNPNVATETEMLRSGVPDHIAKRIVKFRIKGGFFKTKEDLKKIYGMKENLYQQLHPYIAITSSTYEKPTSVYSHQTKQTVQSFDLNKADSLTLVALKGIGPTLATRILKYRLKLGGFISIQQIQEVYGLDSTAMNEIATYGFIDKNFTPIKIDINSSDEKLLSGHPYIGKKITAMILNYRSQHGVFTSLEQLRNIRSIPEPTIQKILPYLK